MPELGNQENVYVVLQFKSLTSLTELNSSNIMMSVAKDMVQCAYYQFYFSLSEAFPQLTASEMVTVPVICKCLKLRSHRHINPSRKSHVWQLQVSVAISRLLCHSLEG